MSALPKPQLRGHLNRYIIRSVVGALLFASINSGIFYFAYMQPRKIAYAEFARTYDPADHLKLLKKYGYLESGRK